MFQELKTLYILFLSYILPFISEKIVQTILYAV